MLGDAKHDTNKLLLKALNDNAMSAHKFGIIITEFEWYTFLKNQVQAKLIHQPSNGDVEQLKKEVRCTVERVQENNYSSQRFKLTFAYYKNMP